jgi:hypothetical protein
MIQLATQRSLTVCAIQAKAIYYNFNGACASLAYFPLSADCCHIP